MQISFDPSNAEECRIVAQILDGLEPTEASQSRQDAEPTMRGVAQSMAGFAAPGASVVNTAAPHLAISSDAPDTRDPAAAFAAASGAPLAGVPSIAGAGQLPTVPAGLPAGLPVMPNGAQLPAQTAHAPAAAPSAPANPVTHVNGVEVDKTGLPWDQRLHASTKSKTKEGVWTKLRGFNDEAKWKAIEAEIRATMALPTPGATTVPTVAPATLPGTNGPASSGVPAQPAATLPQGLPVGSPAGIAAVPAGSIPSLSAAPVAALPVAPSNFDELMPRVTAGIGKTLPEGALEWAVQQCQLPGTIALIQRPDFIPVVYEKLRAQWPAFQ